MEQLITILPSINLIKSRRQTQGIALEAASKELSIRLKYLKFIEGEELEEEIDPVYIIGYLKTYLKFLQIEEEGLVEKYRSALQLVKKENVQRSYGVSYEIFNPKISTVIYCLLLLFLIYSGWSFLYKTDKDRLFFKQVDLEKF